MLKLNLIPSQRTQLAKAIKGIEPRTSGSLLIINMLNTNKMMHDIDRGGGVISPKSYVDVPAGPRKSDFFLYQVFAQFPNYQYNIFKKKKYPILNKLGAFNNNLPKNTQFMEFGLLHV